MRLDEIPSVIVQAGGRGSRLGRLTANKPKCLLSVDGEPLLYRLFRQLPRARFVIVADHHADVLAAYLATVPPKVDHVVVRATGQGTLSGLSTAVSVVDDASAFLILWCDLFFAEFPTAELGDRLLVGLSDRFRCRWSVDDQGRLVEVPSDRRGVAGLFAVPSKKHLPDLPLQGEFVRHLRTSSTPVDTVVVPGMREFGTLEAVRAYAEEHGGQAARFFNEVEIRDEVVVKAARLRQYDHLIEAEAHWYETVTERGFPHVPRLRGRSPLTIERIDGVHPFDLDLTPDGQARVVTGIMDCFARLHALSPAPPDPESDRMVYHEKTVSRLSSVRRLLPNVDRPALVINGRTCRNPLHPRHADWFATTMDRLSAVDHALIHGDPTFSNTLVDRAGGIWLIDPRGTFGRATCYGDPRYDWSKLLYSVEGNYDQFNRRNFALTVAGGVVTLRIASNGWERQGPLVRERTGRFGTDVDVIHALIWLSLTGYALDDVDSAMGAFYQGVYLLEKAA
ncbi:NTP transferase domain-containing protein [Micromonospora rifamycinica]|uniref:NTP transferase domain-containing protein n=1 Tax=Micromonospora rifamycinica TaxID=291594 RepID=UPI00342FB51D